MLGGERMVLDFGDGQVQRGWGVEEKIAPGFSRVYWVQGGEVWYEDDRTSQRLRHNHVYLFPSASCFQMHHNPEDPLVCTYLHLDLFPTLVQELISIPFSADGVLQGLFPALRAAIVSGQTKLVSMLSDVFEAYLQENGILRQPAFEISKVLLYIAEHIREPIHVDDLSGLSGYNPQYFTRLFKKSVGLSPYQYLIQYRMNASIKLLKDRALTVTQIAEAVGYPDTKSFDRAFRDKYGVSPGKFRKFYVPLP